MLINNYNLQTANLADFRIIVDIQAFLFVFTIDCLRINIQCCMKEKNILSSCSIPKCVLEI